MKTKLLFTALATLMLLTTACSNENKDGEVAGAGAPGVQCVNCSGFVAGAAVFSGTVSNGASRIDGLQIVADANSLATATQSYSNPKTTGTYQGLVTGGTFTSVGSACLPDGTYQVSGFQVGTISQSLTTQASNPLWVALTGPTSTKATMYIAMADTNGDDVADAGTRIYLWINCNGWTRVDLTAN